MTNKILLVSEGIFVPWYVVTIYLVGVHKSKTLNIERRGSNLYVCIRPTRAIMLLADRPATLVCFVMYSSLAEVANGMRGGRG
jgi:hypothetical protein